MADKPPESDAISICVRCRPSGWTGPDDDRPGARLARAIEETVENGVDQRVRLRRIYCMSQCKRPCVVAFSGDNKFTYLFGDLEPSVDAAAVLRCFDLYRARPDGFMERWERPEIMREGVLGRVPPLGSAHKFMISDTGAPRAMADVADTQHGD